MIIISRNKKKTTTTKWYTTIVKEINVVETENSRLLYFCEWKETKNKNRYYLTC